MRCPFSALQGPQLVQSDTIVSKTLQEAGHWESQGVTTVLPALGRGEGTLAHHCCPAYVAFRGTVPGHLGSGVNSVSCYRRQRTNRFGKFNTFCIIYLMDFITENVSFAQVALKKMSR